MAMAAFHLLRRNTCWKMHPTISQFKKTSLSPSLPPPSFLCSFPLVPSLWCSPPLRLEYRSTTILKREYNPFREQYNNGLFGSGDVNVGLDLEIMGGGEYVLKIKRTIPGGSEVERAKQMAQNAAMLMLHGELLQDMGQKLLAQSRASLIRSIKVRKSDSR